MKSLLFIDDGYTHDACIAEVKGIHSELVFSYRPMTHEECDRVTTALRREPTSKTGTDILAEAIAKHVTHWNADIEITKANVKRIVPVLFEKMYAVISGVRPSDPMPSTGEKPEAYQEGEDAKNS